MIALLQRATEARVTVAGRTVGEIGTGVLALVCAERGDTEASAERLVERILSFRLFEDAGGKMNLSLSDTGGGLLLVPQFTLAADTRSGNRPSFTPAAEPALGRTLFDFAVAHARSTYPHVAVGEFGAHMHVSLVNDGPVTFWLRVDPPA